MAAPSPLFVFIDKIGGDLNDFKDAEGTSIFGEIPIIPPPDVISGVKVDPEPTGGETVIVSPEVYPVPGEMTTKLSIITSGSPLVPGTG